VIASASPQDVGDLQHRGPQGQRHLGDPLYAEPRPCERSLEREAYATSQRVDWPSAERGEWPAEAAAL